MFKATQKPERTYTSHKVVDLAVLGNVTMSRFMNHAEVKKEAGKGYK